MGDSAAFFVDRTGSTDANPTANAAWNKPVENPTEDNGDDNAARGSSESKWARN